MLLRKSYLIGLIAAIAACSTNERDPITRSDDPSSYPAEDGGGTSGGSGANTTNGAGSTGGTADNGSGSNGNGGAAGEDAGASGDAATGQGNDAGGDAGGGANGNATTSRCGAPLDASAPTAASVTKDGPHKVTSYSSGIAASPDYKSLTVYYPTDASGPYVVVMISPGLTEVLSYLQGWANRFASHGYVAVFVEANNTNADSAQARANGLWAGISSLKAENSRAGSPLKGKLSDCFVTSGHSLGGGASLLTAKAHPSDLKAALGFNPYEPSTNFASITAPTLILTGENDSTASPSSHGRRQYNTLSASLTKQYVEAAGGNHQSALFPGAMPSQYALSWIKYTVDGDERFRPLLAEAASGLSDFASTLP